MRTNKKAMNVPYVSIRDQVLAKLEAHLPELQDRFGIETIGIFGSVARGEDAPDSDVDVLYKFRDNKGSMRDVVPLMYYLEELFGRNVDLVSFNFISPLIEEYVKRDMIVAGTAGNAAGEAA